MPFMIIVEKAFAYVTNGHRLLVFTHADFPEAGVQVPAGTVHEGESPGDAAVREVHEETGLTISTGVTFLGIAEFDATPYGKAELHRRHFFHMPSDGIVPERWRHYERHASGKHEPIAFDLYWAPLAEAIATLSFNHGALASVLLARLREGT